MTWSDIVYFLRPLWAKTLKTQKYAFCKNLLFRNARYGCAGCTLNNHMVTSHITVLYIRCSYLQYLVGFLKCTLIHISNISEIRVHLM